MGSSQSQRLPLPSDASGGRGDKTKAQLDKTLVTPVSRIRVIAPFALACPAVPASGRRTRGNPEKGRELSPRCVRTRATRDQTLEAAYSQRVRHGARRISEISTRKEMS